MVPQDGMTQNDERSIPGPVSRCHGRSKPELNPDTTCLGLPGLPSKRPGVVVDWVSGLIGSPIAVPSLGKVFQVLRAFPVRKTYAMLFGSSLLTVLFRPARGLWSVEVPTHHPREDGPGQRAESLCEAPGTFPSLVLAIPSGGRKHESNAEISRESEVSWDLKKDRHLGYL